MAKNQKKRRRRRKKRATKILFVLELLVLAVLIGGIFIFAQINKKLESTQDSDFDISKVEMNEEVVQTQVAKGYQLIALVGVNPADGGLDYNNSDTMIIACINNDTKEVSLVSLYRDTYLRIGQDEDGNGIYNKANAAYARYGPEGMISMMNKNLDLNISDYVAIDFSALVEVVDALGGIDITLTHDEIVHMNNYCVSVSEYTGKDYEELDPDQPGTYTLNGVQATSYARIRYTAGLDFKRTQRQRLVITKIMEKAKNANLSELNDIMDAVFPMIKTSFSKADIIKLGSSILSYEIGETTGFPFSHYLDVVDDLDCVVPVTLEYNVKELHKLLFGEEDYQISSELKAYNDRIVENSGYGDEYIEKATAVAEELVPDGVSEADSM